MSNFSESHKIINNEIITNGEGEITGEVMNDVSSNQEFIEMQNWRSESKQIAKEILENF